VDREIERSSPVEIDRSITIRIVPQPAKDPPVEVYPEKLHFDASLPKPVYTKDTEFIEIEVEGRRIKVPKIAGNAIEIIVENKQSVPAGEKIKEQGISKGSGLKTRSVTGHQDFDSSAPEVLLGADGESLVGRGGQVGFSGKILTSKGPLFFYGLGGLAILAGCVVAIAFKQVKLGIGLVVGGLAVAAVGIIVDKAWWVVFVPIGLLIAGIVWVIFDARARQKVQTAFQTVVAGVENARKKDPEAVAKVTSSITETAGGETTDTYKTTKDVVTGIKEKVV